MSEGRDLRGDIFGGVTAGVVALPLALAFGEASGAGPIAGLWGAIIVGFLAAVFGGTATQVSGPGGARRVPYLDASAARAISTISAYADEGNIAVLAAGLNESSKEVLVAFDADDGIAEVHPTRVEALASAVGRIGSASASPLSPS